MKSRIPEAMRRRGGCGGAAAVIGMVAASLAASNLAAATDAAGSAADTLRVCAAKNAPPFSSEDGSGFENRLAVTVAAAMGRKVQMVYVDKPAIYLVRDALDKHACDVIMGLDTGDPRVLSSKPYYRTGYVFVTRAEQNLNISSWNDPRLLSLSHFAVSFDSPGEEMLKQIGKYDDNLNYDFSLVNFKSRRNQYVQIEGAKMAAEVASGKADIAVAFAPEIARYVKRSSVPLRINLIADDAARSDKQKVPQQFSQSAAVRKDDAQLLAQIDAALVKSRPDIRRILLDEGIPLIDEAPKLSQEKHASVN